MDRTLAEAQAALQESAHYLTILADVKEERRSPEAALKACTSRHQQLEREVAELRAQAT